MAKYYICEIGTKVNRNKPLVSFDKWLDNVIQHIKKRIDPDFNEKKFRKWLQEDGDQPFISGKDRFFW